MTTAAISLSHIGSGKRVSTRTVILVLVALGCVLYAVWQRTVPPGPMPRDAEADTMCLISRIGLGGLCK